MRTTRCACGGTLAVIGPMELWQSQVLAHNRTKRHQDWSQRFDADEPTPRLYEEHLTTLLRGVQ